MLWFLPPIVDVDVDIVVVDVANDVDVDDVVDVVRIVVVVGKLAVVDTANLNAKNINSTYTNIFPRDIEIIYHWRMWFNRHYLPWILICMKLFENIPSKKMLIRYIVFKNS